MSSRVNQKLSLMIPRVFPQWVDEQKMIDIFHQQHIGKVYKVSIIRMPDSKKRDYPIYQAFIYFSAWYENDIAFNFQQRIYGPKAQARVVYDDPWFWVAFENTKRRLSNNDKRIMRLGYQAYLQEQEIIAQDQRIRQLEDMMAEKQTVSRYDFANDLLSRPAPIVPGPAPLEPAPIVPAPLAFVPEAVLNWNKLTEEFSMKTLGSEMELTETAMNCAEAALADDDNNQVNYFKNNAYYEEDFSEPENYY